MSRIGGGKKSNESQKAKALRKIWGDKDREDDFYDLERKDNILGRNKTRLELREELLTAPIVTLDKVSRDVENSLIFGPRVTVASLTSADFLQRLGEGDLGGRLTQLRSEG